MSEDQQQWTPAVRFSESPLWARLRDEYESADVSLWNDGGLPTYVTSNAALASRYARVILGWLRDLAQTAADGSQRVTIVELGCGTGRFTFQMLHALRELDGLPIMKRFHMRYVATDISADRLDAVQKRPPLRTLIADGQLEMRVLDATSETAWEGDLGQGPCVVIANYVFDSLPADCFLLADGKLHETRVALPIESDIADRAWRFSHQPIELPYYNDEVLDEILRAQQERGRPECLLFPVTVLRALDLMSARRKAPVLVLAADKMMHQDESQGIGPQIEMHGKSHFSLPVDFELLSSFVRARGGQAFLTKHGNEVIAFGSFVLQAGEAVFAETGFAFEEQLCRSSPGADLYLVARLQDQAHQLTLPDFLALLRLSRWDPMRWVSVFPLFMAQLERAAPELRGELVAALGMMAARCYPVLDGLTDMPFLIGSALLQVGEHRPARLLLERSIAESGAKAATSFQLARAMYKGGELRAAAKLLREALEEDPEVGAFLQHLGISYGPELRSQQLLEQIEWEASVQELRLGHSEGIA